MTNLDELNHPNYRIVYFVICNCKGGRGELTSEYSVTWVRVRVRVRVGVRVPVRVRVRVI